MNQIRKRAGQRSSARSPWFLYRSYPWDASRGLAGNCHAPLRSRFSTTGFAVGSLWSSKVRRALLLSSKTLILAVILLAHFCIWFRILGVSNHSCQVQVEEYHNFFSKPWPVHHHIWPPSPPCWDPVKRHTVSHLDASLYDGRSSVSLISQRCCTKSWQLFAATTCAPHQSARSHKLNVHNHDRP